MKKRRIPYLFLFLCVVCCGILSRKIAIIPLCFGDALYAIMMYVLVRILFFNQKTTTAVLFSLTICYSIEFFQLYQADWIIALRKTLFGRYVLGQGFLWSDLLAYTIGIAIAFIIEKFTLNYTTYETRFRIKQQK
ncbi:DUF2809 domain-containing protein [Flavobacterium sp. N502536]|uniref:ribosomal maturation YjgA family protein n=1 Tax=Flavobacterium sp. N502536 TaxID=2986837 RepID=UPI00222286BF|nr:DUF2809 domain-containing protein [Flavobacterium sp. N502536]